MKEGDNEDTQKTQLLEHHISLERKVASIFTLKRILRLCYFPETKFYDCELYNYSFIYTNLHITKISYAYTTLPINSKIVPF